MSEKKTIEAGFKEEIEKCQSRISFLDKNIEIHKNMLRSWTNEVARLEERIEVLQKLILALND